MKAKHHDLHRTLRALSDRYAQLADGLGLCGVLHHRLCFLGLTMRDLIIFGSLFAGALVTIMIFAICKSASDYDDETERMFRSLKGDDDGFTATGG